MQALSPLSFQKKAWKPVNKARIIRLVRTKVPNGGVEDPGQDDLGESISLYPAII